MIIVRPMADVRGLGDATDVAVAAGAVAAAEQPNPSHSFWRPVLIGTVTAASAWLITHLLESAFESEDDDLEDEEDDESEDDEEGEDEP